jgi:hypothetical protein
LADYGRATAEDHASESRLGSNRGLKYLNACVV